MIDFLISIFVHIILKGNKKVLESEQIITVYITAITDEFLVDLILLGCVMRAKWWCTHVEVCTAYEQPWYFLVQETGSLFGVEQFLPSPPNRGRGTFALWLFAVLWKMNTKVKVQGPWFPPPLNGNAYFWEGQFVANYLAYFRFQTLSLKLGARLIYSENPSYEGKWTCVLSDTSLLEFLSCMIYL